MPRPFQFGLRDILLVTAIIAALVATITSRQATIAFVTLGILLRTWRGAMNLVRNRLPPALAGGDQSMKLPFLAGFRPGFSHSHA